jgi:GT2 family glycosyltransferase
MVSVIVPSTTGGLVYLSRLMPILSREPDTQIIIIDNNSHDGTTNFLGTYDCLIKVNNPGKSFSQSNNQGAKLAQGDYLLFLNNDTIPQEGFIQEMRATFNLDPKIGIVGTLLYTMDNPKKIQHAGVYFTQDYVPYELGLPIGDFAPGILVNDPRAKLTREVPSVTAACMMVKREVFNDVGGFDENYINGWEDTDFVLKVRELGYKVWYNGNTHVYHQHFGSRSQGRFKFENQNRQRYDDIWVNTGRAKAVLGEFREEKI